MAKSHFQRSRSLILATLSLAGMTDPFYSPDSIAAEKTDVCNLGAINPRVASAPEKPREILAEARLFLNAGCIQEAIWHLRRNAQFPEVASQWTRSLVSHMTETPVDWEHPKNRDWSKTASAVKFRLNLESPTPALGLDASPAAPATAGIFKPDDGGEKLAGRAFKQNPRFEVAAYQLSEYLRAYLVPTTVLRKVHGLEVSQEGTQRKMNTTGAESFGSFQYFLPGAADGGQGRPDALGGPLPMPARIRIFNEVLHDMDRENNNKNWMIQFGDSPLASHVVIDNNLSFNPGATLFDIQRLRRLIGQGALDPDFRAGLEEATLAGLKEALKDPEGNCLLGSTPRRDSSRLKSLWQRILKIQAILREQR